MICQTLLLYQTKSEMYYGNISVIFYMILGFIQKLLRIYIRQKYIYFFQGLELNV